MVTASPIEGFLLAWGLALKALKAILVRFYCWLNLVNNLDNISKFILNLLYLLPY